MGTEDTKCQSLCYGVKDGNNTGKGLYTWPLTLCSLTKSVVSCEGWRKGCEEESRKDSYRQEMQKSDNEGE